MLRRAMFLLLAIAPACASIDDTAQSVEAVSEYRIAGISPSKVTGDVGIPAMNAACQDVPGFGHLRMPHEALFGRPRAG
jgi:hypothetical protein